MRFALSIHVVIIFLLSCYNALKTYQPFYESLEVCAGVLKNITQNKLGFNVEYIIIKYQIW